MILPPAKFKQVQLAAAIIFLAIVTYLLHGSALNGFWRFDDGAHLAFAATYSPWQYFFIPEITRLQSGANVTPWNILTYDINLSLFGLNPKGFYAHQLISLWLASVATFFLLRLWVSLGWAVAGSIIFLLGAPTVHIAQELMSGQYLEGLLFAILALYAYVHSVRSHNWSSSVMGAILYLLATSCKELFVPLAGILLFLPEGKLKTRFQFAIPYGLVALAYIPWRYAVLGKFIGGYNPGHQGYDFWVIAKTFANIPFLLFGDDSFGKIALVMIVILLLVAIWTRALKWSLIVICAILLLLPLVPLVINPGISNADRYLFLLWWSISIFLSILLANGASSNHFIVVACALMLMGVFFGWQHKTERALVESADLYEKSYRFMLDSNENQAYVAPNFMAYFGSVLKEIIKVEKEMGLANPSHGKIIIDEEHLSPYLDTSATSVWRYSQACHCVENITKDIPAIVNDYRNNLREEPLSVKIKYESLMVSWEVGPYDQGKYGFVIDGEGLFPLPRVGNSHFVRPLGGYIRYQSPLGWITRSPHFYIDPADKHTHLIEWKR